MGRSLVSIVLGLSLLAPSANPMLSIGERPADRDSALKRAPRTYFAQISEKINRYGRIIDQAIADADYEKAEKAQSDMVAAISPLCREYMEENLLNHKVRMMVRWGDHIQHPERLLIDVYQAYEGDINYSCGDDAWIRLVFTPANRSTELYCKDAESPLERDGLVPMLTR